MQDLRRITYLTSNYSSLQGLRMVPLGLFFLAKAAGRYGLEPFTDVAMPTTWAWTIACLQAPLLYVVIGFCYKHSFGSVKHLPLTAREWWLQFYIPAAYIVGGILDALIALPVSFFALLLGFTISTYHLLRNGKFMAHYVAMGALLMGVSVAGVAFSMALNYPLDVYGPGGAIYNIVLGLTCVVGGIIDHLLLLRTFKHARQVAHG